jgi:hypothetical protein
MLGGPLRQGVFDLEHTPALRNLTGESYARTRPTVNSPQMGSRAPCRFHLDAHCPDLLFNKGIEFLDDVEGFVLRAANSRMSRLGRG